MALGPTVTARRLSDAQLAVTEFRYTDPENNIENLNLGVPDPSAHPTIIGYYDETPPGGRKSNPNFPFVRCCHCGKRRHWKGHVVRDDRDQIHIIGASKCGREHYGVRYDAAETAFKAERMRRVAVIRWRNMLKLVSDYRAEVTNVLATSALGILELKRNELQRASPVGFKKLVQIAEAAETMFENIEFRDEDAEKERQKRYENAMATFQALSSEERRRRRDEGLKPQQETAPIYRRQSKLLGHLVGGGFLTDRGDVRRFARDLLSTLDAIDAIQQIGTDQALTSDLTRLLREMTDRPRALDGALGEVNFAPAFFTADNLERIARWSTSETRFSYARDELDLIVDDASKGQTTIKPIVDLELPMHDSIRASRNIDEDFLPEIVTAA